MTLASRRLCVLVAVFYSAWVIAPLVDHDLDPWASYASEYYVAGRPAAPLLRTADGLCGILLVIIAVLTYSRIRTMWRGLPAEFQEAPSDQPHLVPTTPRGRMAVRAWCAGLAVAGFATVLDAVNPMWCAPSASRACAAAESADKLPIQHDLHTVSSAAVGLGFMLAMVASLALSTRRDYLVRITGWIGLVTITLSGIDALVTEIPTEGITQRISMVAIVIWLVTVSGLPVLDHLRVQPAGGALRTP